MLQLLDTSLLLDALLLGGTDEVYLINASTMQLVYVSESVIKDSGCTLEDLKRRSLEKLLGVSQKRLQGHVDNHRHHAFFIKLLQDEVPSNGNIRHDQLRVMIIQSDKQEYILVIKNDFSITSAGGCSVCRGDLEQRLLESEARCLTMLSNTPGLVFQFQLDSDGEMKFIYLSEGCQPLVGLSSEELKQNPKLFYEMMNARDRASLRKRIELSTIELGLLNWEGRVWIDGWQDTKWINVRSIPRVLNNGVIQWEGIMTNITQSKNEKHDIEKSRRDLAELTSHIHKVKESERSKIAREIHDDLGGNLTAIKIGLSSIINRLNAGQNVPVEHAQSLESIVDSTFEAVHRISSDLRPNVLDLGIVAALEWQSKEFEKQLDVTCQFTCNQSDIPVTSDQAITLFRIFQESMSNIAKHAKATYVSVDLSVRANEIVMTISDNGVGIESSDKLKVNSFGLRGMQERVTALHGSFSISKSGEQGTAMTIKLPI